MRYRVAFASSDGKVVNQHFGRAVQFLIVEVNDEDFRVLESRKVEPLCSDFEHSEEKLLLTVQALSDCKIVFVQKIGFGALGALKQNGIEGIEAQGEINVILDQLRFSKIKLYQD